MLFATIDELGELLGRTFETDIQRAQAFRVLTGATGVIQRAMGKKLVLQTTTETLRGTWAPVLRLPQTPIVDVASVSVDGVALADGAWEFTTVGLIRSRTYLDDGSLFEMNDAGGFWGGPHATIEVEYTHGVEELPEDIKVLCMTVAARMMQNPTGVKSETLGQYSVEYGTEAALTDDERKMLRSYKTRAGTLA